MRFLGSLAIGLILVLPAMAAPAPTYSWTGFYLGGNAGAAIETQLGNIVVNGLNVHANSPREGNGVVAGGTLGWN